MKKKQKKPSANARKRKQDGIAHSRTAEAKAASNKKWYDNNREEILARQSAKKKKQQETTEKRRQQKADWARNKRNEEKLANFEAYKKEFGYE